MDGCTRVIVVGCAGLVLALGGSSVLTACSASPPVVDDKVTLTVPGSEKPCYLVELEAQGFDSEDVPDQFECMPKELWDKQTPGQEVVRS